MEKKVIYAQYYQNHSATSSLFEKLLFLVLFNLDNCYSDNNFIDDVLVLRGKQIFEEGREEGLEEGIQLGMTDGFKIGYDSFIRQAKLGLLKQIKIFIEKNMTTEEIIDLNELFTADEVEAIRSYLKDHNDCSIEELGEVLNKEV